jgi:hypothetical protein
MSATLTGAVALSFAFGSFISLLFIIALTIKFKNLWGVIAGWIFGFIFGIIANLLIFNIMLNTVI